MTISATTRSVTGYKQELADPAEHDDQRQTIWNSGTAWQQYCGYLDLNAESRSLIQSELLNEQVHLVSQGKLGSMLLRNTEPASIEEFRRIVPLTTYADYTDALNPEDTSQLPPGQYTWAHTTGARADFKWIPYTRRAFDRLLDNVMGAFILSAAKERGDVNIGPGTTVMYNTPPRPYLSGLVTFGMRERFGLKGVIEPEDAEKMEFKSKVKSTFAKALGKKVDYIISMTSVLVRAGETFEGDSKSETQATTGESSSGRSLNARAIRRIITAKVKSAVLRRPMKPKDLWPARGIIGWGVDTAVFKDRVHSYWGKNPFEMYACSEGGVMATQSHKGRGLIFSPYSGFFEFIPEAETFRARSDRSYSPKTVLIEDAVPGETYEVVVTSFYGMPFLRYRLGHLVRFMEVPESGFEFGPEFEFLGRADDRIDVGGFTRVDEATIWKAIRDAGLNLKEWTMALEHEDDRPFINLYAEMADGATPESIRLSLHESLKGIDPFYSDLESMLGIQPLRVSKLEPGTFNRFYDEKRADGRDLHELQPPRTNPGAPVIADLLRLSRQELTA
ncbi:MAG: GH3 auxin-responsive promoter family protein [Chloroflexi bacterium]|nr:GH3 auxin-responsive promoter family protein [Chloroflexota bacterium]